MGQGYSYTDKLKLKIENDVKAAKEAAKAARAKKAAEKKAAKAEVKEENSKSA